MHIAILGAGLIGGSLARALSARHAITLYDKDAEASAYAVAQGWAARAAATAGDAVREAEIIVFAVPPLALGALAAEAGRFIPGAALVTDVASVKRQAIAAIAPYLPDPSRFVPAHPIAGSEQSGIRAAQADLFQGKRVALTPDAAELGNEAVAKVAAFWQETGARVDYMPADIHDRIYGYVSHLPQFLAFAARDALPEAQLPATPVYARFCRLMHSDAALWDDIFRANRDMVWEAWGDIERFLRQMQAELASSPEASVTAAPGSVTAPLAAHLVSACLAATVSAHAEETGIPLAEYGGQGLHDMLAPSEEDPAPLLAAISAHAAPVAARLEAFLAAGARFGSGLEG